ncbi:MAG: hypothetical protein JWO92_130 [Chitinophagaceae bacterium]|nr:hypothetical protein [Chitinophagaceae bacterium]MDB5222722.1 hypothetical protein [Chitinophagaceae bacterium]
MGYSDFVIFPFYLALFAFIFSMLRRNYKDPLLKKYHKQGFWVKVLACIAFTIFNAYISPGDSTGLYHQEGVNIYHLILKDFNNIDILFSEGKNFDETLLRNPLNAGYFKSPNNFLVTKLVTVFSFFTLGKYMVINLVFALIAFTGAWKLFLFFYEQYPGLHKKFAIAILFLPTFIFWSAGILKDSICVASIGWITYGLYEIFYRKKGLIKNALIVIVFSYLLIILKVYILISYVPFFILFIILKNVQSVNNIALKYLLTPALILGSMFGFTKALNSYGDELGQFAVKDVTKSIKRYNKAYENQVNSGSANSNFSLGVEFDGTVLGLAKLAPIAISTTFFRPFLWESHKPSTVLSSIEALLLMLFTLYIIFKAGFLKFFKLITSDPLIMYCFLFSCVFALFVGASTLNFGSLVRYKIPCMPFYLISLFLIHDKVKQKAVNKLILRPVAASEQSIFHNEKTSAQLSLS